MREITNFKKRGGKLVMLTDSVTGQVSKASWSGNPKRFWVKGFSLSTPLEVYELSDDEQPEPREGWSYALGFFG